MPKKGIIKCDECYKEFEGMLPDHKKLGHFYVSTNPEDKMDSELIDKLQNHHFETRETPVGGWGTKLLGHRHLTVFLEDGSEGEIRMTSYIASYHELGKERG